jgi:hypothetical protein
VGFEQAKLTIVYLGISGDFREIAAYQGEMVMFVNCADRAYSLLRSLVAQVTPQGITRVGGVGYHASLIQNFDSLFDQPWLRILRMYGKKLRHLV